MRGRGSSRDRDGNASLAKQLCQHLLRIEEITSNSRSALTMPFVIPIDLIDRRQNFLHLCEREKPVACGIDTAKSGFLHNDRSARREIGRRSITEPSAAQADVLILRYGPLSAGIQNILAIGVRISRKF